MHYIRFDDHAHLFTWAVWMILLYRERSHLFSHLSHRYRPYTSAEECRKKWYSLRSNYMAEKRKVVSSRKSGAAANSVNIQ
jgi:hypothetical protein